MDKKSPFDNAFLKGNHDDVWTKILETQSDILRDEVKIEENNIDWWDDGGKYTYHSYMKYSAEEIQLHLKHFYQKLKYYHIEDNKLFVHAGIELDEPIEVTLKTIQILSCGIDIST